MPVIDLAFPLRSNHPIPADHAFQLYSAVCGVAPWVHDNTSVGIFPIAGHPEPGRKLRLHGRSRLCLRLPSELLPAALALAGVCLDVGGVPLRVGAPTPSVLRPSPSLYSRLVVVKGFMDPPQFLEAVRRNLAELGVLAEVAIPLRLSRDALEGRGSASPELRRTLEIHGKRVVGFAVGLTGLAPEGSLKVQERGIGGRRRFGCGVFQPVKE